MGSAPKDGKKKEYGAAHWARWHWKVSYARRNKRPQHLYAAVTQLTQFSGVSRGSRRNGKAASTACLQCCSGSKPLHLSAATHPTGSRWTRSWRSVSEMTLETVQQRRPPKIVHEKPSFTLSSRTRQSRKISTKCLSLLFLWLLFYEWRRWMEKKGGNYFKKPFNKSDPALWFHH